MPLHCSIFGCFNTSENTKNVIPKIHFYNYPGRAWEKEKLKIWTNFAKRITEDSKPWMPSKNSRICSAHFINNEKSNHPSSPSFHPTIHPTDKIHHSKLPEERYERLKRRHKSTEDREDVTVDLISELNVVLPKSRSVSCQTVCTEDYVVSKNLSVFISSTVNGESSTYVKHELIKNMGAQTSTVMKNSVGVSVNARTRCFEGYNTIKDNDDALLSLTSLKPEVFKLLLSLMPTVKTTCFLTQENKLLIFLMRLKLGISYGAIAALFYCHRTTISQVFISTLQHLYQKTNSWIFWPTKEAVKETMPESFKMDYSNCRVILDCTEVKTEKPATIEQQTMMYSNYKNSFTVKFLVGITPGGLISFISKSYGGRTTDSYITVDSGILSLLEPEDLCMADKGFPQIQNDCNDKNIILVMPPFSDPNNVQFSESDMEETYKIASVRIHVERMIRRIKVCNILNTRMPTYLLPYVDQIIYMCCVLANLQSPIIKNG